MNNKNDEDSPWGLLIPIVVLVLVLVFTQVIWILIPIAVLVVVLLSEITQEKKIKEQSGHITASGTESEPGPALGYTPPKSDDKPIYDKKKQKEESVTCGTFIPIIIIGWLFYTSQSWIFLIPLFFLLASLFERIINNFRGRSEVKEAISTGDSRTIQEIADSAGVSEEKARRHIVHEKRSGTTDVWFDPSTGQTTRQPTETSPQTSSSKACVYCGFALKSEDRFCPYCGAPIMAKNY